MSNDRKRPTGHPTTPQVAYLVTQLKHALRDRYGVDYAFTVIGNGQLLAASTMDEGNVEPDCTNI